MMERSASHFVAGGVGFGLGILVAFAVWGPEWSNSNHESRDEVLTGLPESGKRAGLEGFSDVAINDPNLSFRQLARIAEARVSDDPAKAVEEAIQIPGHDNREAYLRSALQTWGEMDGLGAAEWCRENLEGELLSDALFYTAEGWAEKDPESAGNWFRDETISVVREDGLWEVLEAWGRKDPGEAFLWADSLDEEVREMVMDGLAQGWASLDPESASEVALSVQSETYGYDFLTSVAIHWGASDPEAASAWAGEVLNERSRRAVFEEIGTVWAETKPEAASAWAEQMEEGENRDSLLIGIANGWGIHDPDGAADWALASEAGEIVVREMMDDIIYSWSTADPNGVVRWLNEKEEGPRKDEALAYFSSTIVDVDAQAAVAWANQISDLGRKEILLHSLVSNWIQREGQLAINGLRSMELPQSIREEFLPDP
ncbi:MAG: hypothetical protein AAGC68_00705 [Verrucomicrobiota bacterium]